MTHETSQPPASDLTAVRLSARQWLCTLGLSLGFAWLLPVAWTGFESFKPVPHYRVPYELSNDYWLNERWLGQLPPDAIPVVGDSVVWGAGAVSRRRDRGAVRQRRHQRVVPARAVGVDRAPRRRVAQPPRSVALQPAVDERPGGGHAA